ncbi:hypothetical protein F5I97DRAFT_1900062 [Phlebopus sp. FC_14]|nr:hypothetical protein F5I97DRAFT_1900062 [Phlebopus sp. FC_14]
MSQPSLPSPQQQPTLHVDAENSQQQSQPGPALPPAPDDQPVLLFSIITSAAPSDRIHQQLRSFAPKDVREVVLASLLPDGQDPLTLLDIQTNTLGILYILSARLHTSTVPSPPLQYVAAFCRAFIPEQARLAPDRVTLLAKGIPLLAESTGSLKLAIQPLFDLLVRYAPSLSHLTTIQPIFLKTCVSSRQFVAALPVLEHPITTIDLSLSDLHYNDNLVYHYAGGMVYAALKQWAEAEELFEICACSPGPAAAGIQMEALKKLILVQLIHRGKMIPPPKYIHPALPRLLKGTPYSQFVNAFPQQRAQLRSIVDAEQQLFMAEKTLGLVMQALDCAPRWSIRKLTATYLTLHLSDIGQAVGIESEDEVRAVILDMIESSEIRAKLSADGTVSFSDPPVKFEKADVDRVLARAQEQGALLSKLEKEMAKSKEYLVKAMKGREDTTWGSSLEDDVVDRAGVNLSWADDVSFT